MNIFLKLDTYPQLKIGRSPGAKRGVSVIQINQVFPSMIKYEF